MEEETLWAWWAWWVCWMWSSAWSLPSWSLPSWTSRSVMGRRPWELGGDVLVGLPGWLHGVV